MSVRRKVVIAGAGPVGMVGALRLAQAGLPVTVLEQGSDLATDSKASTFHPPTLELLADVGLIDAILAQGLKAPVFQHRERHGGVLAELDLNDIADVTAYPYRIQLEQSKLTRLIRPMLSSMDNVEIIFDAHVDHVVDRGGWSEVHIDGRDEPIETEWLIGADGANSMVRQTLGFEFDGVTFPERFLVMSTSHDFRQELPDLAYVAYITDPDEWMVLLRTPDHWRCLMPVSADEPNEEAVRPERIEERLQGVVPIDGKYPLLQHSLYNVHQRVASHFSQNKVLIAGDSAHMNNPLGGMGMNFGIHDAFNLAPRLAAVLNGEDAATLDEYDRQRRTVAQEYLQRQTIENKNNISQQDPVAREAFYNTLRATVADPDALRTYLRRVAMIEGYERSLAIP
jgi:3-(3-hydroxy-phenyl)propionate hydroxylase